MRIFRIFICSICLLSNLSIYAQTDEASVPTQQINLLTADSLASGSYKDVLTSFFQLAINDITGPQKGLAFSSNPYAVMARANPELLFDKGYYRYRTLRKLNFTGQILFDTSYRISGFSLGCKYAILNLRDFTVSQEFLRTNDAISKDYETLSLQVNVLETVLTDSVFKATFDEQANNWITDTLHFSQLDERVQDTIRRLINRYHLTSLNDQIESDPEFNFMNSLQKTYESIKDQWLLKPLWTVGVNSIFNGSNPTQFGNALASSEYLQGFTLGKNNFKTMVELDLLAQNYIAKDSLLPAQTRDIFSFEPGLNLVLRNKKKESLFEFKLSGTYYHIFSNPHLGEKADSSTINATVRLRLIADLWLPATLNYDIHRGKLYGNLGIKLNFTTLANFLKPQNSTH